MLQAPTEYKLKSPPTDAISSLNFGPNSNQYLLASSWDGSVRLYDVISNSMRYKYKHDNAVLDCCFTDSVHAYSGGLDNTLKAVDLNCGTEAIIGYHNQPVRCIEYSLDIHGILTGSWDHHLRVWDPRIPLCRGSYNQGDKIYTMSICGEKIVVGIAGRKVFVWDVRNMRYPMQKRLSNLKYQTRCIRCFPNKQGYVLSTIEGRVCVEYFDTNPEIQKKKYAFKCHRIKEPNNEKIFPVNTISFHPLYNTFATGGSDCYVNIWDGFNKKRLCQFHQYHTSITSLNFSHNGSLLAVGCSYFLEEDTPPNPMPENIIYIRSLTDQECKPKYGSSSASASTGTS